MIVFEEWDLGWLMKLARASVRRESSAGRLGDMIALLSESSSNDESAQKMLEELVAEGVTDVSTPARMIAFFWTAAVQTLPPNNRLVNQECQRLVRRWRGALRRLCGWHGEEKGPYLPVVGALIVSALLRCY